LTKEQQIIDDTIRNKLIEEMKDIPWIGAMSETYKMLFYTGDMVASAYYKTTGKILTEDEAIKLAYS